MLTFACSGALKLLQGPDYACAAHACRGRIRTVQQANFRWYAEGNERRAGLRSRGPGGGGGHVKGNEILKSDPVGGLPAFRKRPSEVRISRPWVGRGFPRANASKLFSERPSLMEGWKVEKIQEIYLEALKVYVDNRRKPRSGTIFAKLLSVLTELRTLGNQNSEMCFSLKLKNKKLPPFLAEIWDVIP